MSTPLWKALLLERKLPWRYQNWLKIPLWKQVLKEHSLPWEYCHLFNGIFLNHITLSLLNLFGGTINIIDKFGGLGDTLLAAMVCKNIKKKYPKIKLNCKTTHPDLLKNNPYIDSINKTKRFRPKLYVEYNEVLIKKNPHLNMISSCLNKIGIKNIEYKADIFLSKEEKEFAKEKLKEMKRPIITINVKGGAPTKDWPDKNWQKLVNLLVKKYDIIQLGSNTEPNLKNINRFAGFPIRESIAIQAHAKLHIGCESFFMHAANAVNVLSVIILGGRSTPDNTCYQENKNIYIKTDCSPCWLNTPCPNNMKCMKPITPEIVYQDAIEILGR